jgi:hypothetical protein
METTVIDSYFGRWLPRLGTALFLTCTGIHPGPRLAGVTTKETTSTVSQAMQT